MHKAFRILVITLAVLAVAACGLKIGDKMVVKIAYTGTLADGSEFDSSKDRDPLEFMVGSGQMIPKFEENLIGLRKGDKKTFTIVAADAYGERDDAMLIEVPLKAIPADLKLEVGMRLLTTTPQGGQMEVKVAELRKDVAVIDYNHPLAGKDLTFAIEVADVRKPTKEELSAQQASGKPVAQ
jgi:peptidylprolyl isomerase